MKKTILGLALAALIGSALYYTNNPGRIPDTAVTTLQEGAAIVAVILPAQLSANAAIGKRAFDAKCADCHGANAAGQQGVAPPLVHPTYRPGHHADAAFLLAAQNGVKSHHWPFGNMPPVPGLTQGDLKAIVTYIRDLQTANGIN